MFLKGELVFACQFFLFETEFKEPYRKLRPKEVANELPSGAPIRVDYIPQEWMSEDHYLAAHQQTTNGAAFVLHLL